MITVRGVDLHVGGRTLLTDLTFQINPGNRIGLIGRNGAGKTTLLSALSGVADPAAGFISRSGTIGYLAQDSRAADPQVTVRHRILSARGLDRATIALRRAEAAMARADDAAALQQAMDAYDRAETQFRAGGGYAAEAEAARVAVGLGLPERAMDQAVGQLSGGQRRRVELARVLVGAPDTLLLDEPTNHLDLDSVTWLRGYLQQFPGGIMIISHDRDLLASTVNRVFEVDGNRRTIDIYNTDWRAYLAQRDAAERRRDRERANAERKAASLNAQADKMRALSSKAVAAKNMARRADAMLKDLDDVRKQDRTVKIKLPEPAPVGRVPITTKGISKSYGDLDVLTDVDLSIDRGGRLVVLGLNGAGKTTLLRLLAGVEHPDSGQVIAGYGLQLGYFAQEHETLDPARTVRQNLADAAPQLSDGEVRHVLGAYLFSGSDVDKPAGVLSGGEKTRLALARLVHSRANLLLLDEPTNNLDPRSRDEVLAAVNTYPGAVIMVTHDEGAIEALHPDRVLLLPDATEDLWSDDYRDLVAIS